MPSLNEGKLLFMPTIVMLWLPFALVGGLWLIWWLGFNLSTAVVVGFIALSGGAADTVVVILMYLDQALKEVRHEREASEQVFRRVDLNDAIMLGAVERVRLKMMTVVAIMAGLIPILWSTGTGSEAMQRIAVPPMIGGMVSSTLLTPIVIPAIYAWSRDSGCPAPQNRQAERRRPKPIVTRSRRNEPSSSVGKAGLGYSLKQSSTVAEDVPQ